MEQIIELDKQLLLFLNGLGSKPFDDFWGILTKQIYWSPFFLGVFYLLKKKMSWKEFGIVILFLAVLVTVSDQLSNVFKNYFQRIRPCNDLDMLDRIRMVSHSHSYSYYSAHASSSLATTYFLVQILKKQYNFVFLLYLFPLLFAYSRIYLGVHYPLDIISGFIMGIFLGYMCTITYRYFAKKYNLQY